MSTRIYMDHHATTPTDERVIEKMMPWFAHRPGNPASPHAFGWEAAEAVEEARTEIANLLHCDPKEIVFTAGATESNNLALQGAMHRRAGRGHHLVTTAIEHPSVLETARHLERAGAQLTVVGVDRHGQVSAEEIKAALRPDTVICSVMAASNEVGTLQPIEAIAAACHDRGVLFHCDATQAIGRVEVDMHGSGIDLLSLSAHKFYGPKGIGALLLRRRQPRVRLDPLQFGGGQQEGLRPGTLPVPLIVGLGEACRLAAEELDSERQRLGRLRERLLGALRDGLDDLRVNGHPEERLAGNLSVTFIGVESETLLLELPGIGLSAGAACGSGHHEASPVLLAMGLDVEQAQSTLRFGLGRANTEADVDLVAERLIEVVRRLRSQAPVHPATGGRSLASRHGKSS